MTGTPSDYGMLEVDDNILSINGIPTPTLDAFYKSVKQAGDEIQFKGFNVSKGKVEQFSPIPMR